MCSNIIHANPFKSSFRWKTADIENCELKMMVFCSNCNEISEAVEVQSGRHRYSCPLCKKRIIKLHKSDTYITKVYSKVFDYEEKVVFSCAFHHHILKFNFNKRKMRKMSVLYRYNVTHNKITKQTYLVRKASNPKNNKIANITYGCIPRKWSLIWSHLEYIEQDSAWKEFRESLLPSWFDLDKVSGIRQFPFYLRYPQLGMLPLELTLNIKFRQELKKARGKREELLTIPTKQIAVLEWLTDKRITKIERKILLENPNLIFMYRMAAVLFENVDVRHYFLADLLKRKYLSDSGDAEYFSEAIIDDLFKKRYVSAFLSVKKHFANEKKYARELLQLIKVDDNDSYGLIDIFHYIRDIEKMEKELCKEIPGYQLPPFQTLRSFHDTLAKDYEKIKNKCISIEYTETEKEKLQFDTPTHHFKLAKSNHELVDVGSKLGICVGSYSSYAIKKELFIVLIEDKGTNTVTHCLEVANGKKLKLVQAKGKYNGLPSKEISEMVMEYSQEKGIVIDTYDITSTVAAS
ncbi:hypothetical protein BK704_34585 [[Bacillus thuringiensis] serovar konkukian]|nr:PcfJ domain-containing protein [Bacillus thuringiensis]MED1305332.1 PcfJ domain-containing protein [Bacillus pacificus]OUA91711.1 hypothetical protein BK704_34585 [[Bacillus thuringiensis] serovar konkukian]